MNPTRLYEQCTYGLRSLAATGLLLMIPAFLCAQLSVSLNGTPPTCNGYANGMIEADVSGGVMPYTFDWGSGPTSANILQSIPAGNYSVTVTDSNNDSAMASITLGHPAPVTVDVSLNGNVCDGGGNATATATGGTGNYSYSWDNGDSTAMVSGLSAGFHCVTVTDENGCAGVGCITITGALELEFLVQGLACFNFCDASIEAIVTGGTPPYTYIWSNGDMDPVNENLGPGTYSVTVTDQNGCTISGSSTIGNAAQIIIDVTVTNPPCGSGATGSASATASGGTAPYSFLWSTGETTSSVTGLLPGTYGLTVTDFVGCTESTAVTIVEDSGVMLDLLTTPSSGCGEPDGTASVIIMGGTGPFDILWSNGSTASDVLGLAPGNYSVTVTDAQGCGATGMVTVGGSPAIDLNITGVNAGCAANGSANAMVTPGSGTPPFDYEWNTGATTAIINNIGPGTYSVTVTDAEGCMATDMVTVTGSANISVSTSVTNLTCFGSNDGSATATASGATGTVSYMWSNGGSNATISGLSAGTYFVTVVDNMTGCTATTNAFISQPPDLEVEVDGTNGSCIDPGAATALASGGTPPYSYEWNNGATDASIVGLDAGTYTVTVTDDNGCTATGSVDISAPGGLNVDVDIVNPSSSGASDGELTAVPSGGIAPYDYLWNTGATTATITGLEAGTYSVTVTDDLGCTGTAQVTLVALACIGDRVWEDLDKDGCQDPGEIGVGGVPVMLTGTDINGNSVSKSLVTMANGQYLFDNLMPGDYEVQFSAPTGFGFSPANACTDDFSDSDADASGSTGTITLAAGHCNVTVDAGIFDLCINISTPGEICCDQVICGPGNDPDPINSVVPAAGGGSPTQYMWMFSTIDVPFNTNFWSPIPGATGASYDPGPLFETTYFIRCAKAAECEEWLESNTVAVVVDSVAVAEIDGPDAVCIGDEAVYTAFDNGPGATYTWDFGPWATPSSSSDQTVSVTWNQTGVYYITLTVINGDCISTATMGVSITNSPVYCAMPIIINATDVGSAVMIEWEMEYTTGGYDFAIQRSADGISFHDLAIMPQAGEAGMHNYSYADYFPKAGNAIYRLVLRENGETFMYSNEEYIRRFASTDHFIAYPNPAGQKVTIEANEDVRTAVKAEVMTLQGKQISRDIIPSDAMNHTIDLTDLRAGVYLVRLTYNDGETVVKRIVKE